MLKAEIIEAANKQNTPVTDTQFRRYIENGLLQSYKKGEGKGKGVKTFYPTNSIGIINEINQLKKKGIRQDEMIFHLFACGFSVNLEKLHLGLLKFTSSTVNDFKFVLSKTKDEYQRQWLLNEIAEVDKPPKYSPGRPTTEEQESMSIHKQKEKNKLYSVIKFLEEIFISGQVTSGTIRIFAEQLGYKVSNKKDEINKALFEPNNWASLLSKVTDEDFADVQYTFRLLRLYEKFMLKERIDSQFLDLNIRPLIAMYQKSGLNHPLKDTSLIKLLILLLLVHPSWRKEFNKGLSMNGYVSNYQDLKGVLPILFKVLDKKYESET